jgi:hypothetical protein
MLTLLIGELEHYLAHYEYDANEAQYSDKFNFPKLNEKANFLLFK